MKPKWLEIALKEVGVSEIKGGENKRILEYHASTTLKAKEDEIPWCSSFVNWCMVQALNWTSREKVVSVLYSRRLQVKIRRQVVQVDST